jgi:hypothetical protein
MLCCGLRCRLLAPHKAAERLAYIQRIYTEVVGVPPKPKLLTSANSSYMHNSPATFRAKLQELVNG